MEEPTVQEPVMQVPELTPREREIAMAMSYGLERQEIAKALTMSVKTYDTHRLKVLKKMECANEVKLAHIAIKRGYLTP